jgi:16S rRNA (guanine966-N2)-methyltransferase
MQVTGGKFRRRRLHSLPSQRVRPTARRVRETLFELLAEEIEGARFVDLCAGSGAVGIEALSRGAAHVTFVDCSARVCDFVELNLAACGVAVEQRSVVRSEASEFLQESMTRGREPWDMAFFDPPYAIDYRPVLALFVTGRLLKPQGLLVVEHHCDQQPEAGGMLEYLGTAELGLTCLSLFEQKSDSLFEQQGDSND